MASVRLQCLASVQCLPTWKTLRALLHKDENPIYNVVDSANPIVFAPGSDLPPIKAYKLSNGRYGFLAIDALRAIGKTEQEIKKNVQNLITQKGFEEFYINLGEGVTPQRGICIQHFMLVVCKARTDWTVRQPEKKEPSSSDQSKDTPAEKKAPNPDIARNCWQHYITSSPDFARKFLKILEDEKRGGVSSPRSAPSSPRGAVATVPSDTSVAVSIPQPDSFERSPRKPSPYPESASKQAMLLSPVDSADYSSWGRVAGRVHKSSCQKSGSMHVSEKEFKRKAATTRRDTQPVDYTLARQLGSMAAQRKSFKLIGRALLRNCDLLNGMEMNAELQKKLSRADARLREMYAKTIDDAVMVDQSASENTSPRGSFHYVSRSSSKNWNNPSVESSTPHSESQSSIDQAAYVGQQANEEVSDEEDPEDDEADRVRGGLAPIQRLLNTNEQSLLAVEPGDPFGEAKILSVLTTLQALLARLQGYKVEGITALKDADGITLMSIQSLLLHVSDLVQQATDKLSLVGDSAFEKRRGRSVSRRNVSGGSKKLVVVTSPERSSESSARTPPATMRGRVTFPDDLMTSPKVPRVRDLTPPRSPWVGPSPKRTSPWDDERASRIRRDSVSASAEAEVEEHQP